MQALTAEAMDFRKRAEESRLAAEESQRAADAARATTEESSKTAADLKRRTDLLTSKCDDVMIILGKRNVYAKCPRMCRCESRLWRVKNRLMKPRDRRRNSRQNTMK